MHTWGCIQGGTRIPVFLIAIVNVCGINLCKRNLCPFYTTVVFISLISCSLKSFQFSFFYSLGIVYSKRCLSMPAKGHITVSFQSEGLFSQNKRKSSRVNVNTDPTIIIWYTSKTLQWPIIYIMFSWSFLKKSTSWILDWWSDPNFLIFLWFPKLYYWLLWNKVHPQKQCNCV